MTESTSDQEPWLGQEQPFYPELDQFLRVARSRGSNLYDGYVQQFVGLVPRDREACLVTEANGLPLGPGLVEGRLMTSYLGLPLFATSCCPTGAFAVASSSSGSSSSASATIWEGYWAAMYFSHDYFGSDYFG